jgi:hypothetical protein
MSVKVSASTVASKDYASGNYKLINKEARPVGILVDRRHQKIISLCYRPTYPVPGRHDDVPVPVCEHAQVLCTITILWMCRNHHLAVALVQTSKKGNKRKS